MRMFEITPEGTVTLDHAFVRNDDYQVSSTTVLVSVHPTVDESDNMEISDFSGLFDYSDALVLKQDATYDSDTGRYSYELIAGKWHLGIYLIEWRATINGNEIKEYDKLHLVAVTRESIIDSLGMPSSATAGGITMDYSARLKDQMSQRGIRVGRIIKNRGTRAWRRFGSDRDYNRGN